MAPCTYEYNILEYALSESSEYLIDFRISIKAGVQVYIIYIGTAQQRILEMVMDQ